MLEDCYLTNLREAVGNWTSTPIDAGELIGRARLSVSATGIRYPDPGPGRRLLTLDLDAADANGFWLSAGSRVDLYMIPVSRENGIEVQIMENIRIMAILSAETGAPLSGFSEETGAAGLVCLDLASEQARLILSSLGLFNIRLAAINESEQIPAQ